MTNPPTLPRALSPNVEIRIEDVTASTLLAVVERFPYTPGLLLGAAEAKTLTACLQAHVMTWTRADEDPTRYKLTITRVPLPRRYSDNIERSFLSVMLADGIKLKKSNDIAYYFGHSWFWTIGSKGGVHTQQYKSKTGKPLAQSRTLTGRKAIYHTEPLFPYATLTRSKE